MKNQDKIETKWITRFIPVVISGMMLVLLVPGCGGDKGRPSASLDKARAAFGRQDYNRAANLFRQAAAADPRSVDAWTGLARTCIHLGDMKGATDAYQRILRIDPDHTESLLGLARFDLLANNATMAEEKIRHALQKAPENTDALFLMADLYSRTERFFQAEKTYEQILPLVSDKTSALIGLARIQARTGDPAAALESLKKAVNSAPDVIEPRLMLFNYYYGQNDFQNAEQALLQAIAANPDNTLLRILLGKYYYNRNRMDDAEAAFLKAIKLAPDSLTAYLVAGKFYSSTNKPEAALKMFEKAGNLRPLDIKVSTMVAEFYIDHGFLQEARRTIADILKGHPGYFPARQLKIKYLLAEKDYDQAISFCDTYLKSNPAADNLLVFKGIALIGKGQLDAAEKALTEAVKVAPANIIAKFRLLDVYLKEGKIEQAQQLNRDIFGYLHENFDVTVVLGDTELQKEKVQKGLDSLDSLSRFASTNPFDRFRAEHLDNLRAEYDRLMSEFNRILEKRPDLFSVFENVILLHAARKEYDVALAKCDQQIERVKDNPGMAAKIYNIKGGLYLAQHKIEKAKDAFAKAIALAPDFLKPYYGLAKIYIINKDIDGAITQYATLLEKGPQQPVTYLLLGVLSKMKREFPAAEDYYRKALAIDPDLAQAANNLAYLLADQGKKLEEALALALHAKNINKDDPYILDTLGWVYFQQGAYDDAVRELSLSAKKLPDSAEVNYHLGMAYYKTGNTALARKYLERASQFGIGSDQDDEIRRILLELK